MNPTTSIQAFVITAFQLASTEISGEFGQFGVVLFLILLSWHLLLGGAELSSGDKDCRFLKGSFWVRVLTVFAVLASVNFDMIFITLSRAVATSATNSMVTVLSGPWTAVGQIFHIIWTNIGNLTDSSSGIWTMLNTPLSSFYTLLYAVICCVLCTICYVLAAVLMEVQVYTAIAYAAIILMLAPVLLPFGLHQSTEGIAWQYVKGWLVYGVLYLPVCLVAMKLASALLVAASTTIVTNGLSVNGAESVVVQFLSMIAAPLAVIGIVFVPNAALNKVL